MNGDYTRNVKVAVPFRHCLECPAFKIEVISYETEGVPYFTIHQCEHYELCKKIYKAAQGKI